MNKYKHLEIKKDEYGHITNLCPFGKRHKNGALIFIGGLSCVQCKMYHGKDDDGQIVCKYGTDNISKTKKEDTYNTENKD